MKGVKLGLAIAMLCAAPAYAQTGDGKQITLPDFSAPPSAADARSFDRYFYFHRDRTSFDTALSDIEECDQYAQKLSYKVNPVDDDPMPLPGASLADNMEEVLANVLTNYLSNKVIGGAKRRDQRRTILRRCMFFKGYARFGVAEGVWKQFNFEEGNGVTPDDVRRNSLIKQAKVASGERPKGTELGE